MSTFIAKRAEAKYVMEVPFPAQSVFELLCPVAEAKYLHDWNYTMLFSECGKIEEGAVFSTRNEDGSETIWTVTVHDEYNRKITFSQITPELTAGIAHFDVVKLGDSMSKIYLHYTLTGISEEGNKKVNGFTQKAFTEKMSFEEKAMIHYLKTGEKLMPQDT